MLEITNIVHLLFYHDAYRFTFQYLETRYNYPFRIFTSAVAGFSTVGIVYRMIENI